MTIWCPMSICHCYFLLSFSIYPWNCYFCVSPFLTQIWWFKDFILKNCFNRIHGDVRMVISSAYFFLIYLLNLLQILINFIIKFILRILFYFLFLGFVCSANHLDQYVLYSYIHPVYNFTVLYHLIIKFVFVY